MFTIRDPKGNKIFRETRFISSVLAFFIRRLDGMSIMYEGSYSVYYRSENAPRAKRIFNVSSRGEIELVN